MLGIIRAVQQQYLEVGTNLKVGFVTVLNPCNQLAGDLGRGHVLHVHVPAHVCTAKGNRMAVLPVPSVFQV